MTDSEDQSEQCVGCEEAANAVEVRVQLRVVLAPQIGRPRLDTLHIKQKNFPSQTP